MKRKMKKKKKIILEKKAKRKKMEKKHAGKVKAKFSTSLILKKKIQQLKKHVGKHCSNPRYFKEKNYEAKFPTSSI